jgi:hypothetical protein
MVDANYAACGGIGDYSFVNASPEISTFTTTSFRIVTVEIQGISGDNRIPSNRAQIYVAIFR